jgi:hypothetical protein
MHDIDPTRALSVYGEGFTDRGDGLGGSALVLKNDIGLLVALLAALYNLRDSLQALLWRQPHQQRALRLALDALDKQLRADLQIDADARLLNELPIVIAEHSSSAQSDDDIFALRDLAQRIVLALAEPTLPFVLEDL